MLEAIGAIAVPALYAAGCFVFWWSVAHSEEL